MPRSAIMITKSLKLNLKLVYQLTQRMLICPSKCRPLNSASTGTNGCILSSSPIVAFLHQNRIFRVEERPLHRPRLRWSEPGAGVVLLSETVLPRSKQVLFHATGGWRDLNCKETP